MAASESRVGPRFRYLNTAAGAMTATWLWMLLLLLPVSGRAADKLSIAAASNLVYALESVSAEFRKAEPATEVSVVTGASGTLVAQIQHGAPFDIFLSADLEYPEKLISLGLANAGTFTTFAVGRLVLWTTRPQVEIPSVPAVVRDPRIRKIAVANLNSAPYGKATREALTKLGVWAEAERKVVIGENITQTAQFVETGNADAGFVAMSLVLSPKLKDKGRWLEIDASLHSPIEQGAVITTRGGNNPASIRFIRFLTSPEARTIFERFGYRIPSR